MAAGAAVGKGIPSVLISTSMSSAGLAQRVICARGKIPLARLRENRLEPPYVAKAQRALAEIRVAPFFLDPESGSGSLQRRVADAAGVEGVELVVIDAFEGLVGPSPGNAQDIAYELRGLARDRSIAIVLGLVLPYDPPPAPPRPPALADLLAHDGLLERDDTVLGLWQPEFHDPCTERPGIAQIDVFGGDRPPISIELAFLDRYPSMVDIAR